MTRKRKYRRILYCLLALDLLTMGYLGYRYLDRKIPSQLHIVEGEEEKVDALLDSFWIQAEASIPASQSGSYTIRCNILGILPFKNVKVTTGQRDSLWVSGEPVGLYMETEGVLIIDTGEVVGKDGSSHDPARNIAQAGDYIVAFNEQRVTSKKELVEDIACCQGETATLSVIRHGEEIPLSLEPVLGEDGNYKLGIWVRDNTQGIGTLTYMENNGEFGALGHGISDVDTGELLQIQDGLLYQAEILGIQKGSKGNPGELSGVIRYSQENQVGEIDKNCSNGIYGRINGASRDQFTWEKMPIGYKQDMKLGKAEILFQLDDQVEPFEVEITKIDMDHEDTNKSFVIQVTDPRLLSATGGIVQGMSGSPVIQDGKIVGAVTHVFVQDSSSGYGIFIETMLDQ
ncbi:MAG: SpoIVB peptidase [Blautia sp.]